MRNLLFSRDHMWITQDSEKIGQYRAGITDFAQREFGDIVYIELPHEGETLKMGESVCSIDSLKASSELYMPVTGTITEVNASVAKNTRTINADPYGNGWLFRFRPLDEEELKELMDKKSYEEFIGTPAD